MNILIGKAKIQLPPYRYFQGKVPFNESFIFSDIITLSSFYAFGLKYNENGNIAKLQSEPDIP